MIFRIWPRPMRLSPLGMVTRTRVVRKGSSGGKKDPESGSETRPAKGLRVLFGGDDGRRQKVLDQWRASRRVDSGKGKKKGAVAAALAGGGKALRADFDVTADMTRKVYRDLKKPMASG
ncbi:hypothetical protein [Paracoccus sp. J55]|uniref:hypothetical protein n=1 Tax=Paracoccus sp. J55 TaxID=935849 RepID=UPI0012EBF324|nr:hypothetical protein [Paracoccus sp. J55]